MNKIRRILPAICITLVTILFSQFLYAAVMRQEKEQCWQELRTTAQSVSREICTKFQDELVKLHLIESIMLEDGAFRLDEVNSLHINLIQPTTIFSRIDILYPDKTLVSNGIEIRLEENIDFQKVAQKGAYMTSRRTDFATGRECVYYVLPVVQEEEIVAVLIACVESQTLAEVFRPLIYNGNVNFCIIDADDGKFIMDSWHETLGNAYEMADRKKLPGFEDTNLIQDLQNHQPGMAAFQSETTGDGLYMYYMPIGIFNWQISIFALDKVLFANLTNLRHRFLLSGLTEVLLLLVYFCWNIFTVYQLESSNREIETQRQQLHFLSYRDQLTTLFNRTKFEEDRQALRKAPIQQIGVAFLDVNGLKQLNDSQSHEAGDDYLCRAANVLLAHFPGGSYRIGGDEFVILAQGLREEDFQRRMGSLQWAMEKAHVSISAGFQWKKDCMDVDPMLKQAETEMYLQKEHYYASIGVRR